MTAADYQKQYGKKPAKRNGETVNTKRNLSAYDVLIGIDPGTNTGIAFKEHQKWVSIDTFSIFEALELVCAWQRRASVLGLSILVRVEDARLRTWFGSTGKERWKGAGSIGRDCAIWEEVLTQKGIPFEMVHPKHVKETTAVFFKKLTGWQARTSKHSREAAWLII